MFDWIGKKSLPVIRRVSRHIYFGQRSSSSSDFKCRCDRPEPKNPMVTGNPIVYACSPFNPPIDTSDTPNYTRAVPNTKDSNSRQTI